MGPLSQLLGERAKLVGWKVLEGVPTAASFAQFPGCHLCQRLDCSSWGAGQNGTVGLADKQDILQRGLLILQDIVLQGVDRVLIRWARKAGRSC